MLGTMLTRFFDRLAARAALRFRARIDRYKLARRRFVRAELLESPAIADAVRRHAAETGTSESDSWKRVHAYVGEIVPFFNIIAYYQVGYRLGDALLEARVIDPDADAGEDHHDEDAEQNAANASHVCHLLWL